jgi:hypothetical protein
MFFLFFFRLRVLMIIAVGTLISGVVIYNELKHRMYAVTTTATLLERISKCRVEYAVGAQTMAETIVAAANATEMQCDAAQSLQDRLGDDKVKLRRTDLVRISYVGPNDKTYETKVVADVAPKDAEVGTQFPVVYDPDRPSTVRTPALDIVLGLSTAFFLFGLLVLGALVGFNPARLASRVASASVAGRSGAGGDANWTKAADEAIARALEPAAPRPSRAAAPGGANESERTFGRRAAGR